jgi:polar amino acid transport system substrate-binding protein/two-component system sensor histidine kinase EvgS
MIFKYILLVFILLTTLFAKNNDEVIIQLKWKHSFQFAGYYAALEKGFYKDEGLNVKLKEIDLSKNFIDQVVNGEANYGVSDSSLAVSYVLGKPVVLIAQIFQHSPLVLISHKDSNIHTPYDLVGKKVMYSYKSTGSIPFQALILNTVGSFDNIKTLQFTSYKDFIDRKVDVTSAYSTSQPYWLKKQGIEVNIIDPKSYGVDFYGDNFFTSKDELELHPIRVQKMKRATLKGWKYALEHKDEIIDLIIKKYAPNKDKDTLEFEANGINGMINPDLIDIGYIDKNRYKHVLKIYHKLGVLKSSLLDDNFFYSKTDKLEYTQDELNWIKKNPMLRIAVMRYWKYDKDGNNIHTDILKLLNKYGNISLKPIKFDTWASGYNAAISGEIIQGISNISWSKDREENSFLYTRYYDFSPNYLIVKKTSNIKSLKDLENKTIFLKKEEIGHKIVKESVDSVKIIDVDTDKEMYKKLSQSKDVVAFISYAVNKELLEKYNLKVAKTIYGKYSKVHIALSKKYPELQSIINKIYNVIPPSELIALRNKKYNYEKLQFSTKEKDWIKKHPVINYVANNSWAPFEFFDTNTQQYSGMISDYKKLLTKKTGLIFNLIKVDSFDEAIEKINNKEADFYALALKNEQLSRTMNFSKSYLNYPIVIITKDDKKFISDLSILKGKNIVFVKGHIPIRDIKKDYPYLNIKEVNTIKDATDTISNDKAFAYLEILPSAIFAINQNSYSKLKIAGKTKYQSKLYMALRADIDKTGIDIINKVLESITIEEKNKIYNKWVSVKFENSIDYTLLWQLSGLFLLFILGSLYWNRKLSLEVEKRKKSEEQLKLANIKAQEATKSKSEFLANMSHEIRTPMNSIIGFSDLLAKTIKDPIQKDYLNSIQTGGHALMAIINDILDLSKIEAGKFQIEKQAINIKNLSKEIQTIFEVKINQKNLSFIVDINKNLPEVLILDSVRLRQVLINLIGNAIKFTTIGTITYKIDFKYKDDKKNSLDLIITIKDTGRGIPKELHKKIFDAFEQTSNDDATVHTGTGLGLAICSKLVKLMDGDIKLESEVQKGSDFIITLYDVEVGTTIQEEEEIFDIPDVEFENATILVVDDIAENRKLVNATLAKNNFTLLEAKNGQEALDIVKNHKENIDLILMDLRMPIMNGYEATIKIKELDTKHSIAIIAFTASVMNKDIEQINAHKFDGYIRKPVIHNELISILMQHLKYKIIETNHFHIDNEKLDKDTINNIPLVLEKLKGKYKIRLEQIQDKGDFSLIEELMNEIKDLAQTNSITIVEKYTNEILNAIHSFDIQKVSTLIKNYDTICNKLEDIYKENKNV